MAKLQGTILASKIVPTDSLDTYATHDDKYGRGGHRSVDTLEERDNITTPRRKEGMTVYVKENKTKYILEGGLTNEFWIVEAAGGSGGDVDLSNYYTKSETGTLLSNKVDKEDGKGLSTNDFTQAFKEAVEANKVVDVTTDSINKKIVVTYSNGAVANLNLDDVITDITVEGAVLDATTNTLTLVSSEGGADVVVDLSLFITDQMLDNALLDKADKIHSHTASDIDGLDVTLSNIVTKNEAIIGDTKTKITYDSKGLVTNGADLDASDIPNLPQSKIINLDSDLSNKQPTLVSGTNIKTINGQSVLGSGDIVITSGGAGTGEDGLSAYELYVKNLPEVDTPLSELEWLDSLKGVDGKSAYEIYLDTTNDDPVLNEVDWLSSLRGETGYVSFDTLTPEQDEQLTNVRVKHGLVTTNGMVDNIFEMEGIVSDLNLEPGDVIEVGYSAKIPGMLTKIPTDDGSNPPFNDVSVINGEIYASTRGGGVANGIWKLENNAMTKKISTTSTSTFPPVSDGEHFYYTAYQSMIYKVNNKDWGDVKLLTSTSRGFYGLVYNEVDKMLYAGIWAGTIFKIDPATGQETAVSSGAKNWVNITVDQSTGIVYALVWGGGIFSSEDNFTTQVFPTITGGYQYGIAWVSNELRNGLILSRKNNTPVYIPFDNNPAGVFYELTDKFKFVNADYIGGITYNSAALVLADQTGVYANLYTDSSKYHTVEKTVTDNKIIVNQEHAMNRGHGALMLPNLTNKMTTVRRIAKWYNAQVGIGQGMVPVAPDRNINVNQRNELNRTITLIAKSGTGSIFVNNIEVASRASASIPISPGDTYRVSGDNKDLWEIR